MEGQKGQYDTTRYAIFTWSQNLTGSQLNLPHVTNKQQEQWRKLKKNENRDAQKIWPRHKFRRVSPEAGRETRESMVRKIYERGRFWVGVKERGSYGWWEWWVDSGGSRNRRQRQRDWDEVGGEGHSYIWREIVYHVTLTYDLCGGN